MTLRLPCALDRAQVGPERFGSKGTHQQFVSEHFQRWAARSLSIPRLRRAVLAACGVLADGNRVLVLHLAPRTNEDTARLPEVLPGRAPARLAVGCSSWVKGPEQGRLGAISRRSASTPASGWEIQQVAPETRRAFSARTNSGIMARIQPQDRRTRQKFGIQATSFGRLRVARLPLFGNFS